MNDDAVKAAAAEAMGVDLALEDQLNEMIDFICRVGYPYDDETYENLLRLREEHTLLDVQR